MFGSDDDSAAERPVTTHEPTDGAEDLFGSDGSDNGESCVNAYISV